MGVLAKYRGVGRLRALTVLGLCLLAGPAAGGENAQVRLGELENRAAAGDSTLDRLFRNAVQRELDHIDLSGIKAGEQFVLSATLLRIESRQKAREAESTAVVSATLRRAKGGELHAIIQGRARVVEGKQDRRTAELGAVRGAVKSAVRRVPEALQR